MARKKISEYRAKKLLYDELGISYSGLSITPESNPDRELKKLDDSQLYVVKVDQGIKKRGKQGLVKFGLKIKDLRVTVEEFKKKGFGYFLIEEFVKHENSEEKYLALERVREGIKLYYSNRGGIDIEEEGAIQKVIISQDVDNSGALEFARSDSFRQLLEVFDKYYFSFLELNPYLILDAKCRILDAAVEVDSAAEFFVNGAWNESDFRDYSKQERTPEEKAVAKLAEKSQASFSLTMLNPNGSLCMLLSGGGASIVLADEAHNQGKGDQVANYGEYSGNPNAEETYLYSKQIVGLLLKSRAPRKALIVGGGVANFTDIRFTFKGVIKALSEDSEKLRNQKVKIFVRRGGPHQAEGLKMMREFLEKNDLLGSVHDPSTVLTDIVSEALNYIKQT